MIPSHYRKSEAHRKLYATHKFLSEWDTTSPILKGEYDREVVKAAVDRRRALLEHHGADVLRNYFTIEHAEIKRALLSGALDIDEVLADLREELRNALITVQGGSASQWGAWAAAGHGIVHKADPITTWLRENIGTQITGITETTRKKIAAVVAAGVENGDTLDQQAEQIDAMYLDEIIPDRSMTIARTEVGRAVNWAQQQIADEVDVPMEKEWLALDDARTRESHADADGQRVGINDAFEVGGSELQYPGDPAGPAEEVINCRCTVLHHVVDESPPFKSARRVESPYQFAKSVTGIENPDIITMLAFTKGVFNEADEWTTARDILMKHVYRIRRAEQNPAVPETVISP